MVIFASVECGTCCRKAGSGWLVGLVDWLVGECVRRTWRCGDVEMSGTM